MTGMPDDAHDFRDARFLVRLNVEEENVRLVLRADGLELREQDLAAEIKIQQEKSAQAQRKRQQQGAIVRPVEIRQPLPQDEAPAVREEFPDADDQQLRHARRKSRPRLRARRRKPIRGSVCPFAKWRSR